MHSDGPPILRPSPRRINFDPNTAPQMPPSPSISSTHPSDGPDTPSVSRTHSILNLTSSTLLGIYSPTGYNTEREELLTPWGTGAESPASNRSAPMYRRFTNVHYAAPSTPAIIFSLFLRSILLFWLGMLYGLLVRHLHDDRQLAPFQVEGIIKPSYGWRYLVFWGIAGVSSGSLLPWIDTLWEETLNNSKDVGSAKKERSSSPDNEKEERKEGILGADWTPVVRSVGAFVGIAYALRKLPWTSTLQASLTLALVNPVLWYIIDRSKPGLMLSSIFGITGAAVFLCLNPDMLPNPEASSHFPIRNSTIVHHIIGDMGFGLGVGDHLSRESVEGGIWMMSVLFCSCVCFGNIGRRLALNKGMEQVAVRGGKSMVENKISDGKHWE